jgi:bifunctional DNA-binding transcriptional regulator/antitoxin component of YhaV-PrlF toxin-antitoxin module
LLAKMTSKNQITLPKSVTAEVGKCEYFDVEVRGGEIVLTPVRVHRANSVRAKLAQLGINENDIQDAVTWARKPDADSDQA